MNTIETPTQNPDLLWNDYDYLQESYISASKINFLALAVTWIETAVIPYTTTFKVIIWITTFTFCISRDYKNDFFINRKVQLLVYGLSIAMSLITLNVQRVGNELLIFINLFRPTLGNSILPIFRGMCYYSGLLQLEGLTNERFVELQIEKAKKIIDSDYTPEVSYAQSLLIPFAHSLSEVSNYPLIYFDAYFSEDYPIPVLLSFAYNHKKVLSFPFVRLVKAPATIFDLDLKQFALSVDYLIECKKSDPNLDEAFVNTQLEHFTWGWYFLTKIPHAGHLAFVNGIPVIKKGAELGDISELKQKLVDCFGSVIEIN